MKRRLLFISLLVFSLALSGCIDSTTKVTVNGDGSGIITEIMGMSKEVVEQMQQMMPAEDGQMLTSDDFFKEEDFIEKAAEYGEGVELVDFSTSSNDKSVYAQAVFKFDDVTRIKIKQGDTPDMGGMQTENEEEKYITFAFDKSAANPTLKIMIPQADKAAAVDEDASQTPPAKPSAGETAMMKQMFAGMHFAGLIEVNGKVLNTNASYTDGNKITLFDIEFDKLLDKPEILAQLQATQSPQEAQELFKNIDGLKVETAKEIDITFAPASGAAAATSLDETVAASRLSSPLAVSPQAVLAMFGTTMIAVYVIANILVSLIWVWFFARIFRKAGFSPAPAFLLLIPVLNGFIMLILLMVLAFVDWPVYEKFAAMSSQFNDINDEPVLDEPVLAQEQPEIKLDDTAAFSRLDKSQDDISNGVPLPGESNHTKGSLDSNKLTPEQPPAEPPKEESGDKPQIVLSNGNIAGDKPKADDQPEETALPPQKPPLEPVAPEPQVEMPAQPEEKPQPSEDAAAPAIPEPPAQEELKLPEMPKDEVPKLPEDEEGKEKNESDDKPQE
jgi:hypothetical protein